MGFRSYKSVRSGKGVRLNLSKTGVGISGGAPGARYSVHSSGRTVKTVGVPGTGVYYRKRNGQEVVLQDDLQPVDVGDAHDIDARPGGAG